MTKHWVEEMMESEWFLVEDMHKRLNDGGYPEIYYTCWIATSPYKDKARAGYRVANMQRWFGPDYNGEIEQAVGRHLVDAHNAFIKKTQDEFKEFASLVVKEVVESDLGPVLMEQVRAADPALEKKKSGRPKGSMTPEQRAALSERMKNRPRRADGTMLTNAEIAALKAAEDQAPSGGAVPQGQPVQTQNRQEPQEVQPESQAPRKIPIMGSTDSFR